MKRIVSVTPVSITPAMVEAINYGVTADQLNKVKEGGLVALESIKHVPFHISKCYAALEKKFKEYPSYSVNMDITLKVTERTEPDIKVYGELDTNKFKKNNTLEEILDTPKPKRKYVKRY